MNITLHRQRASGFTLIEMMVAVAILAILASLAAPAYQGMIAGNRVSAATNEILELLSIAQAEARNRQVPVSITITSVTDGQRWSVAPTSDSANVVVSALLGTDAKVAVTSTFTNLRFQPDGKLGETTTSKAIEIKSTAYSTTTRKIEILGSGKVILINQ
ncbi:GspH/FimT family pseudopilin [Azonexus sp.]|uniref:GspH/FimT family pseudopilin n=1 Tax=Azonexus sp. TaxID=1872668 RepID=UPI0035AEC16B